MNRKSQPLECNYSSKQKLHFNIGWKVQSIILTMVILQSIGIRALPIQGVVFGVIICLILIPRIGVPIKQLLFFIITSAIFTLLAIRGMSSYTSIFFLYLNLLSAFFFVQYVKLLEADVEIDLLKIMWILSLHSLLSYIVYILFPNIFYNLITSGLKYKIFGIFIVSGWTPIRATGFCWEPGLMQYIANLSLFLGIKHSWPKWKLGISFLTVVATFSTVGIIALIPTMLYLLIQRRRTLQQYFYVFVTFVMIFTLTMTIFRSNFEDKFSGKNVSALVRLRDLKVGWDLLQQKPLLGHGQVDESYLLSKSIVYEVVSDIFSKEYLSNSGEMSGGYTNGFLALWAGYGIFIGTFIYWCFFNNNLIRGGFKERLTFFSISVLTFISEPITNTSWFFIFVFSGIYTNLQQKQVTIGIESIRDPKKATL